MLWLCWRAWVLAWFAHRHLLLHASVSSCCLPPPRGYKDRSKHSAFHLSSITCPPSEDPPHTKGRLRVCTVRTTGGDSRRSITLLFSSTGLMGKQNHFEQSESMSLNECMQEHVCMTSECESACERVCS